MLPLAMKSRTISAIFCARSFAFSCLLAHDTGPAIGWLPMSVIRGPLRREQAPQKDHIESCLCRAVCAGRVDLDQARRADFAAAFAAARQDGALMDLPRLAAGANCSPT